MEHADRLDPAATVVHAEVYVDPQNDPFDRRRTTEVVDTLRLGFEPSLYVADEAGVVTDAIHWAFDRRDLGAALAGVTV